MSLYEYDRTAGLLDDAEEGEHMPELLESGNDIAQKGPEPAIKELKGLEKPGRLLTEAIGSNPFIVRNKRRLSAQNKIGSSSVVVSSYRMLITKGNKGTASMSTRNVDGPSEPHFDPGVRKWVQQRIALFPQLASMAPLLNALIPCGLPNTNSTKNLSGPLRSKALADYLSTFLAAESTFARRFDNRNGLTIIIDDAQVRF
jgi:hypothetical protein